MKKLMVAFAVVAIAMASQAASWKWNASGVTGPGSKSTTLWDCSAVTVFWAETGTGVWHEIAQKGEMTGGSILSGVAANNVTIDETSNPNRYDFYYTMTANVDGKDCVYTSNVKANVLAQKSSTATVSFSGGSWAAVPEPTSGLLLLLGVAGLALRRRRA